MRKTEIPALTALAVSLLAGCSSMQVGSSDARTVATGAADGANSQNANSQLRHCDAPMGTIQVVEDTSAPWYGELTTQMHLGATTPVLKLLIQQSNCFVAVERGRAMNNMMQERQLAQAGELRASANFGKGQLVAADYSLSPSITFNNNNAVGAGGGLASVGSFLGPIGLVAGAVAGSVQSKQASTLLTLNDNRSSVQIAAPEGSAKNWDFGGAVSLFGGSLGAVGGGYANTAEGKLIVAAFMDAYNGMVNVLEHYQAQHVQGGLGRGGKFGVHSAPKPPAPVPSSSTLSVADVQERLNALGFNVGRPDGAMGAKTRSELLRFQRARGIPASGKLDELTLNQLTKPSKDAP